MIDDAGARGIPFCTRAVGRPWLKVSELACARERGFSEMIGYVPAENEDMVQLMIDRGYDARRDEDPAVIQYVKNLQPNLTAGGAAKRGARHSGAAEKV